MEKALTREAKVQLASSLRRRYQAAPDQTSQELLAAFKIQYPDRYHAGHLRTVQRRMKIWRHQAVQKLIIEMDGLTEDVSCDPDGHPDGKELREANGKKIT